MIKESPKLRDKVKCVLWNDPALRSANFSEQSGDTYGRRTMSSSSFANVIAKIKSLFQRRICILNIRQYMPYKMRFAGMCVSGRFLKFPLRIRKGEDFATIWKSNTIKWNEYNRKKLNNFILKSYFSWKFFTHRNFKYIYCCWA